MWRIGWNQKLSDLQGRVVTKEGYSEIQLWGLPVEFLLDEHGANWEAKLRKKLSGIAGMEWIWIDHRPDETQAITWTTVRMRTALDATDEELDRIVAEASALLAGSIGVFKPELSDLSD